MIDDIDLIEDEINATKNKTAHTRKGATPKAKRIKVRSSVEVAKDEFKRAKRVHRAEIKRAKRVIKQHRLLIKQARGAYKLIKL